MSTTVRLERLTTNTAAAVNLLNTAKKNPATVPSLQAKALDLRDRLVIDIKAVNAFNGDRTVYKDLFNAAKKAEDVVKELDPTFGLGGSGYTKGAAVATGLGLLGTAWYLGWAAAADTAVGGAAFGACQVVTNTTLTSIVGAGGLSVLLPVTGVLLTGAVLGGAAVYCCSGRGNAPQPAPQPHVKQN